MQHWLLLVVGLSQMCTGPDLFTTVHCCGFHIKVLLEGALVAAEGSNFGN